MDIKELRTELRKRVVRVTFTKLNGDLRIMDCTTNPNSIPPSQTPTTEKVENSENSLNKTIRVFDVEAQGWRSFLVENVRSAV